MSSWKDFERRVATFFGTKRTPFSGGNSGITRADTRHPYLFIECKHRKKQALKTLLDSTADLAKQEGKIPVVCLHEHNQRGFLVVCRDTDLLKVAQHVVSKTEANPQQMLLKLEHQK
jgi:tRNA1(Val) A37 N6-methylase TrmN6